MTPELSAPDGLVDEPYIRQLLRHLASRLHWMNQDEREAFRAYGLTDSVARFSHVVASALEIVWTIQDFDKQNKRVGRWFPTYSGWRFWPLDPRPGDFNIQDIARSLSRICRFNGHLDSHYSVAQHCVLMHDQAPPSAQFLALMHDAPEAYYHDVATPIKRVLGSAYSALELKGWDALCEQFQIDATAEDHVRLKELDQQFLHTEARDYFPLGFLADGETWGGDPAPSFYMGVAWESNYAMEQFLERFSRHQNL